VRGNAGTLTVQDAQRERWNELYARHGEDSTWGPPSTLYEQLCDLLPPRARILDLGCGDGRHAIFFARRGFKTIGVDISDVAIHHLEQNAGPLAGMIDCRRDDISSLWPLGRFDLVICHGVLNSLPPDSWRQVLDTVRMHTRMGGMCAVVVFSHTETVSGAHPYVVADFPVALLEEAFANWQTILRDRYVRTHDHDGIGCHVHVVERLVATRRRHVDGCDA
jgi:tellurite methyltransferase